MTAWPITIDPIYGCWLWARDRDAEGYGISYRGKLRRRAHIAVYTELRGPLAPGIELDHECNRPPCCNPDHLTPVTRSQNELRKSWRRRCRQLTCAKGHDLKLHAMVTPEGGRVCRACAKEQRAS